MRILRGAGLATLLGAALFLGQGLAQEVLRHRGKVVVIDMWQFT